MTRKLLYLCCMPILFFLDLLLTFAGFNMNLVLIPILIAVAVIRLSDRHVITDSISRWLKEKLEFAFPDIFYTGVFPNERFLLVTVPLIIAFFVNIKILDFVG